MSSALSEAAAAAAESVTGDLLVETAIKGDEKQQAKAREHLENMGAETPPEPEPETPPEPAAEEPTDADPEDAAPQEIPQAAPAEWFEPDERDFEAEARAQLEAEAEPEVEEFGYEDDPRLVEERAKRLAAEKQAEHFKAQRVKDARKAWIAEAQEHAPLAVHILGENLEKIDADSKRSFLRQAGEAHEAMRAALGEVIGPAKEVIAEETAAARAEAKAAAETAFGKPTTGPGAAPTDAAEKAAAITTARENKGLTGAIRAMLDTGMNP